MKELTIQEKARRYDEAIKLVNSKWYYKNQPCFINVSELFPEFKENKNENIRKWLIEYFQEYKSTGIEGFANGLKIDSIVAWLEKQINDEDIHLLNLKAKAYDDAKQRMNYAYNQNRVPIGFITEIFPNLDLYKTQDNKSISETIKIELKFKIGDWVVFNNNHLSIYQVEKIENGYYILRHIHGGTFRICILHDEGLKLWTIQDAKDGDILYFTDDIIAIFKNLYNATTFHSYCHIENGIFGISKDDMPDWWESKGFHPATKEQRDLLFTKIKEAGYKWDENKKELIKL